jgi:exonuclease SbcD
MIRLVWRTDVHLCDQNPQSRTDNWSETILEKLEQVGEIAREVKALAVLDGGDFFDKKSPPKTSHWLNTRIHRVHDKYPCPVYANIGNHDCKYGDYKQFLEESPLETLFASGRFVRCYDKHEALFLDESGLSVRVVGIPYHGAEYDLERFKIKKGQEDFLVVMAHVLASAQGGTMFRGENIIRYSDLLNLAPGVDIWAFGHWHKDQGIEKIESSHIINVGSLSRGSLAQDDIERVPACAILSFDVSQIQIEKRSLRVAPALEVFDIDSRAREESRAITMDSFVDSIRTTLESVKAGLTLSEKITAMDNIPDKVRERALFYIEQADAKI